MTATQNSGQKKVDGTTKEVKAELRGNDVKNRYAVLRLGNSYESVVANQESICEEIKTALREEIAEGIISRRTIERYCPDKWKKKTKPKRSKNDEVSFSREPNEITIAVATDGSSQRAPVDDVHETPEPTTSPEIVEYKTTKEFDELPKKITLTEFEFSLKGENVRRYLSDLIKNDGFLCSAWFHGSIDVGSGKVTDANVGKLPN